MEMALSCWKAHRPSDDDANPIRWNGPPEWRLDYMNVARLSPEEIARRRAENDRIKAVAQGVRDSTLAARG